jgi:hypothetical protein
MTEKIIKNEQWSVKTLVNKITNKDITKPKYQRKRKWDILQKKENTPNERQYIDFLYETHNSVHAITFGENSSRAYTNIDGNNRINAISHFLNKPFELYPEYLDEICLFIDRHFQDNNIQSHIKPIFTSLSYTTLMNFKYNIYFIDNNYEELYKTHLKPLRDEFEPYIESLQRRLKINGEDNFDTNVKINVNLFEGYTTDELCKTFEDINKFNSKLTEIELLACRLYNVTGFEIENNVIHTAIKDTLVSIYKSKSEDEVLECYVFDRNEKINAYDFMVGFQNYSHSQCCLIEEIDNSGLSVFFKIYKILYKGSFETAFTNYNVNDFIYKITQTIRILNMIKETISTTKLTGKIFDSCNKKMESLKKNNMYLIMVAIIGYINMNENEIKIVKSLVKCILYHFFIQDISNKDEREKLRINDAIMYEAGGTYIDKTANDIYIKPEMISEKITQTVMTNAIQILLDENNKSNDRFLPSGNYKNDKRRPRKFFEKTLMFFYYKQKVPIHHLQNEFWMEHICPFSSTWKEQIDIDRLGNVVPIIDYLNNKRNNKHISEYEKYDDTRFVQYIDILPSRETYDRMVSHGERKPHIIDNSQYEEFCRKNEEEYVKYFIKIII